MDHRLGYALNKCRIPSGQVVKDRKKEDNGHEAGQDLEVRPIGFYSSALETGLVRLIGEPTLMIWEACNIL